MERKFKVGDRVVAKKTGDNLVAGHSYKVAKVDSTGSGRLHWVHFDGVRSRVSDDGSYQEDRFRDKPLTSPGGFAVGDRVRMVRPVDGEKADCNATVVEVKDDTYQPIIIKFDQPQDWAHEGGGIAEDHFCWWVSAADIAPVSAALSANDNDNTTTAIVAVFTDGKPRPNARPYVHTSEAAADAEARRLASIHPGQEFGVFVLKNKVVEPVVYDHEWQRIAASGERIAAVKALRHIAGLSLVGAKGAVDHWLSLQAASRAA